jgi:hypothetical protein
VKTKHEYCLGVLRDARNREFLESIIRSLTPGDVYVWASQNEPFTREELIELLEKIKKEAN